MRIDTPTFFVRIALAILSAALIASCAKHPVAREGVAASARKESSFQLNPLDDRERADQHFAQLLAQLKSDPNNADYDELRSAWTLTDGYVPYDSKILEAVGVIFGSIANGQYDLCLKFADAILADNAISLYGNFAEAVCAKRSGDPQKADVHSTIVKGLMHSILKSGDGETVDTAFRCISQEEIRAFVELQNFDIKEQTPQAVPGRAVDLVVAESEDKSIVHRWYFDTTLALQRGIRLPHHDRPAQ